jgi:uridine kinase
MSTQEVLGSEMNEDQPTAAINNNFELQQSQLTQAQAAQYLAEAIQGLPGNRMKLIAVVGGPASGKGELVKAMVTNLTLQGLATDAVSTDDYSIRTRDWRWEHEREDPLKLKDFGLLNQYVEAISKLENDLEKVAVPTYDPETGLAIAAGEENYTHKVGKCDVFIVEGDFDPLENPDLKIFVDMPAEDRLKIRTARDLAERGEVDPEKVAVSFLSRHDKQYVPHTAPAIQTADIAIRVTPQPDLWQYDVYQAKH